MAIDLKQIGQVIGAGIEGAATHSAQAAIQANNVSAASQAAQGRFNQASADNANLLNQQGIASQYGFNAAQAAAANDFTSNMWNQTAAWNEEMWERQASFNAEQAQIQRDWQERMANTQYQRAINDMQKAGLNPILAVTGGGIGTGVPGGAQASVGGAQMSSASGAMASGGLLGANSASEGNYTGQMEFMSGMLGLIGAVFNGLSSAQAAAGQLGDFGEGLGEAVDGLLGGKIDTSGAKGSVKWGEELSNWTKEQLEKAGKWIKNKFTGEKEYVVDQHAYEKLLKNNQRRNNDNRFKGQIYG